MKNTHLIFVLLLFITFCASTRSIFREGAPVKFFVIGTYGSPPQTKNGAVQYDTLISQLKDLHANTYNWLIMPNDTSFEQFKEFLPIAKKKGIDVWATLFAPAELEAMGKQYATNDMRIWAANLARLSISNSNFKAWSIGDFVHNLKVFTPQYVKEFQDEAKKINPGFKFYPVCYFVSVGKNFASGYGSLIDGILFPYRDESSFGKDLTNYSHVADEIKTLRGYLGGNIPVFLFVYSSRHHQIGDPTAEYISKVIASGFQDADGIMIYRHPSPKYDPEKYQAVKAAIAKGKK